MSSTIFSRVLTRSSPEVLLRSCSRPVSRRLYSETALLARGSITSYVAAGVGGGLIVVAGGMEASNTFVEQSFIHYWPGYTWYHFSGIKQAVDATQGMRSYISKSQESVSNVSKAGKASSNAALAYLRTVAKSYAALVPGAGQFIDAAFNSVDEVFDAHQEEASLITQRAYDELQLVIHPSDPSKAEDKLEIAFQVTSILKAYLFELHVLGTKAGGSAMAPIWEKYPGAKEKLEGTLGDMKHLAESSGPGAKKIFEDTQQHVRASQ